MEDIEIAIVGITILAVLPFIGIAASALIDIYHEKKRNKK